ncbi:nicotinamide riboside transporter PnuC [Acinetobacter haemolyticus]|uniref:nicotinamide riboside transporter PnuC n=1 Tax=Acinetobacter haemolyticus TaxID=29430 RepID=UPI000D689A60|nr:nicotinamide riboside transporter PnuC [Acinetobacter haemolyticus]
MSRSNIQRSCILSALEIIAVIMSVIGVTLTIQRNMWCWWFNILACALYGYLFFTYKLYGETILQFFFIVFNFYGFYSWLKGQRQDHDIRIEPINGYIALAQICFAASGGLIFGMVLKYFTDASVPMLDSQLAAFSLLATYWTSRKHIATWMLWIIIDIVYVGLFIYKELLLTAGLYAAFVGLATYGWWQWQQVQQRQCTN